MGLIEKPKYIRPLELPQQFGPAILELHSNFILMYKNHKAGKVVFDGLPSNLVTPYLFFTWYCDANQIIDNLNLVLSDHKMLSRWHILLDGSPMARYRLLIRTYFYEFARLKDVFNMYIKSLRKYEDFSAKDAREIMTGFYAKFKEVIAIRNRFVHSYVDLTEEEEDILLVEINLHFGRQLIDKTSGEKISLDMKLEKQCNQIVPDLTQLGNEMTKIIQDIMDDFAREVHEGHT